MTNHVIIPTGGGDCFYRSLSRCMYKNESHYSELKRNTLQYMESHKEELKDFFESESKLNEYIVTAAKIGTAGDVDVHCAAFNFNLKIVIHYRSNRLLVTYNSDASTEYHIYYTGGHFNAMT